MCFFSVFSLKYTQGKLYKEYEDNHVPESVRPMVIFLLGLHTSHTFVVKRIQS